LLWQNPRLLALEVTMKRAPFLPLAGLLLSAALAVPAAAEIYATADAAILVFGDGASGNIEPYHVVTGGLTRLTGAVGLAVDLPHLELFVSDNAGRILVFGLDDDGDVAPKRELSGAATGLDSPAGMAIDPVNDELWVADADAERVAVFARDADGDVAPLRTISGATSGILNPVHVFLDLVHDEVYVSNIDFPTVTTGPAVTVHDLAAVAGAGTHDVAPVRRLAGATTGIGSPRGIAIDLATDTLILADYNGSLRAFDRDADGDVAPTREIAGGSTGLNGAYDLTLRRVPELLVGTDGSPDSAVVGHSVTADGDATPIRLLEGPSTGLVFSTGVATDRARYCSEGRAVDGCLFRDNFEGGGVCYWSDAVGGPGCF
jgi:hypothetical protein